MAQNVHSAYCQEFTSLFLKHLSCPSEHLKNVCLEGGLQGSHFRSICWQIFLGSLPFNPAGWLRCAENSRQHYAKLKAKHNVNPRLSSKLALSINHPLSFSDQSLWGQYFVDLQLRAYIRQDVDRIFPDILFFQSKSIRDLMVEILFVFAREFDHISYKQGMHEILGPLILVLYADQNSFEHAVEQKELDCCTEADTSSNRNLLKQIVDANYLEHDAYNMFASILQIIKDWYCYGKEKPTAYRPRKRSLFCDLETLFLPERERRKLLYTKERKETSSPLIIKLDFIVGHFLTKIDPQISAHLEALDIPPQVYGIRWLRLLFGREFPIQDLLYLWDAIFCLGPPFILVDCIFVVMLCFIKNKLLKADYAGVLHYLMHYPPVQNVSALLASALHLLEPAKYARPAQFFGNFSNITVAGKPHPNTIVESDMFSRVKKPAANSNKSNPPPPAAQPNGTPGFLTSNPFDTRKSTSPPQISAEENEKRPGFLKRQLSGKPSPEAGSTSSMKPSASFTTLATGSKNKLITDEELELLREQVGCLQSRLNEVEGHSRLAATKMIDIFDKMDDRFKVINVIEDSELCDLIGQVRRLCISLKGVELVNRRTGSSDDNASCSSSANGGAENQQRSSNNKINSGTANNEPVEIAREAAKFSPPVANSSKVNNYRGKNILDNNSSDMTPAQYRRLKDVNELVDLKK